MTAQDPIPTHSGGETYDAGLLNDWGGGNVEWWQDYIRAELGRAHDFYAAHLAKVEAEREEAVALLLTRYVRPDLVNMVSHALKDIADLASTVARLRGETDGHADLKRFVAYVDHEPHMSRGEVSSIIDFAQGQIARAEAAESRALSAQQAVAVLTDALQPFARLVVPKKPRGNAGFYSINHKHIQTAATALQPLGDHSAGPTPDSGGEDHIPVGSSPHGDTPSPMSASGPAPTSEGQE